MMEIMGHFPKAECLWEWIKKCASESHRTRALIGNIEFKAVTKFCYLMSRKGRGMNKKVEFQIKKFSTWFQKHWPVGLPFNITSFNSLQTSSLQFGLKNWT